MTKIMFTDKQLFGLKNPDEKVICLDGEVESFSVSGKQELCIWLKDKPGCYRYNLKNGKHIFVKPNED